MSDQNSQAMPTGPAAQSDLSKMYNAKKRPLCPCRTPGVEMYIAKVNNVYIIKRMPGTGPLHSPDCGSYEPPPELSGLGEVLGSAIKENTEDGLTELSFGFSMTRIAGRAAPAASGDNDDDAIKTAGHKLTLKSVLHYLWEQAGFNRWTPAMTGKRSWAVVQKHLLAAADNKMAKGSRLAEKLYIPEPFTTDNKDAINQRRTAFISKSAAKESGPRPLLLLVGEIKDITQARFGHKIIIKHAPDFPFMLNDDIHKQLLKRYESELELWSKIDDIRMMTIATFGVSATGIPSIEEISLMPVTRETWIPFEHVWDKAIIDDLTAAGRRFTKGMRYNLPKDKPLASLVVSDTTPVPTAMYLIPMDANESYMTEMHTLIEESKLASWTWDITEFEPPALPPMGRPETK